MTNLATRKAPPGPPTDKSRIQQIGELAVRRRHLVLAFTIVLLGLAGWYGGSVIDALSNGGYAAETPNMKVAKEELRERFGVQTPHLLLVVATDSNVDDGAVAAAGRAYTERVGDLPGVVSAHSYWTLGDPALRAKDGGSAIVTVRLAGDDDQAQRTAKEIVPAIDGRQAPFDVRVTGESQANAELQEQSDKDLARAELLAAPLVLLILLLVFRTPLAAVLPFGIGVIGVVLTLAILRLVTEFSQVSIFALNLTTALGLGLAIDYSLFIVMRFREELRAGRSPHSAVVTTVATAGRTVLFSAVTVALSLSALLVFPLYFLRSLAYAAIPVVLTVGVAAIVILPAALVVFGRWLDAGDITPFLRRLRPGRGVSREPVWGRVAHWIMRRPLLFATPVVVVLLVIGAPFTSAKFGLTDDRVLPADAEAYQAARQIERDFVAGALNPVHVVVRDADPDSIDRYALHVSELDGVEYVDGPTGRYAEGELVQPPAGPPDAFVDGNVARLAVVTTEHAFSPASEEIVHDLRERGGPGPVYVAGASALFADTKSVISDRLPYALAVIVLTMFVLLFLFTGSLLVPVKALVFNTLSLTASFGVAVYIFQEGNLKWLVGDFVATGYLDVTVPVLMFCVAFGLSMDYEIFLLSRIREQYLKHGDNRRAVVEGLARTGSLITAAAVLIGTVLVVLATSEISVLKLLGVGLFLTVLVDAVLIRGILVPAFMQVAGRANWWAPGWLRKLHARIGIKEG